EGEQQDYGMRIYDPRIGKFLSVDPLTKSYPWYSPYQFAGNKPIWAIDLDGAEEWMERQVERDLRDIQTGKITVKQLEERVNARARIGAVEGFGLGLAAIEVFVTKGWITRVLIASEFLGAFEHNRAKTPEGRAAQDQRSKEALADAFINWGAGRMIG